MMGFNDHVLVLSSDGRLFCLPCHFSNRTLIVGKCQRMMSLPTNQCPNKPSKSFKATPYDSPLNKGRLFRAEPWGVLFAALATLAKSHGTYLRWVKGWWLMWWVKTGQRKRSLIWGSWHVIIYCRYWDNETQDVLNMCSVTPMIQHHCD